MTGNTQSRTRLLGGLRSADGKGVVRMEDRYDTDIDDLWSAVTDPQRLARWIAEVHGDLRLGGEFHARFTSGWEGTGRVEICEPPHRLMVLTREADQPDVDQHDAAEPAAAEPAAAGPGAAGPDEEVLEAILTADGDQTILVIEARGLPMEYLAAYGAGWQVHVEDLAAHLAGGERCDIKARWSELIGAYQELAAKMSR